MAATADYDAAALLGSPVRRTLVAAIRRLERESPRRAGSTAAELAPVVGLHVTTVRFHLDRLVAAGVLRTAVRRQPGAGRPSKVYALAEQAGALDAGPLRLLSGLLADLVDVSNAGGEAVTPFEAGQRWAREHVAAPGDRTPSRTPGAWLARVGETIDVLERWGYGLSLTTSEGGRAACLELTDCPFLDLARTRTAVVCGVHDGLIAGCMRRFGETSTEVALEPLVTPRTCLARLRSAVPFQSS